MASEPGPAAFFDLPSVIPSLEEPLEDSDFNIEVDGLDALHSSIGSNLDALTAASGDLDRDTFNLYVPLNVVEAELGGEGGVPPGPLPNDLQVGIAETDGAMEDAAAAVPDIVSPPPPGSDEPLPPPPEDPHIIDGFGN